MGVGKPVTKYDLSKSCLIVSTTAARSVVWRSLWGGGASSSAEGERKTEAAMPRSSELYHASLRSGLLFWVVGWDSWFGFVPVLHRNLWILLVWVWTWWWWCFGRNTKELWWWWVLLIEAKEAIAANAMTQHNRGNVGVASVGESKKQLLPAVYLNIQGSN